MNYGLCENSEFRKNTNAPNEKKRLMQIVTSLQNGGIKKVNAFFQNDSTGKKNVLIKR